MMFGFDFEKKNVWTIFKVPSLHEKSFYYKNTLVFREGLNRRVTSTVLGFLFNFIWRVIESFLCL